MDERPWNEAVAVVPLPAGTQGWTVWSDHAVEGPFPAAAVGVEMELPVLRAEHDGQIGQGTVLDYGRTYVLLLFPDFGERESPWIYQCNVFFSREAAEEAAAARRTRQALAARKPKG